MLRTALACVSRGACTGRATKVTVALFGAPGSGKGTIAKWLRQDFNLTHVSTGDLLRAALADPNFSSTERGRAIKQTLDSGGLVDDAIVIELVSKATESIPRLLLDGFPRNINQGRILERTRPLDLVLQITVPHDEIVGRVRERWFHPGSGRIYNLTFSPPKVPGKDDITGEPLIQREDDKEATVRKRLATYEALRAPLDELYSSLGKLVTVVGTESKVIYPQLKALAEASGKLRRE